MKAVPVPRQRSRVVRLCLLASLLAWLLMQLLLGLAWYGYGAKALLGDEQSYQQMALAVLAGGPWLTSTIWPPLQALVLAALYALTTPALWVAQFFQSLLLVLCAALLRSLWRALDGSLRAANTAAALFLLNPATLGYAWWLWPEVLHLALVLAALWLLIAGRRTHPGRAFLAGACISLAILAKSLLSLFWPVLLLLFLRRERPHALFRPMLAYVLGFALVSAPFMALGWQQHGEAVVADSSMYNLWIGLTDNWRSDYVEDLGGLTLPAFLASGDTPAQRNAVYREKSLELVAEQGASSTLQAQVGRQYFRLFSAKTLLVSQLPGPLCAGQLSFYRTPTWLTGLLIALNNVFHVLMLAGAGLALFMLRWRPQSAWLVIGLYLAYQLGVFLLLHVKARFLLPMVPILCGMAGSFLAAAWHHWRQSATVTGLLLLAPWRIVTGASLAMLLLWLAFGGPILDGQCA